MSAPASGSVYIVMACYCGWRGRYYSWTEAELAKREHQHERASASIDGAASKEADAAPSMDAVRDPA